MTAWRALDELDTAALAKLAAARASHRRRIWTALAQRPDGSLGQRGRHNLAQMDHAGHQRQSHQVPLGLDPRARKRLLCMPDNHPYQADLVTA